MKKTLHLILMTLLSMQLWAQQPLKVEDSLISKELANGFKYSIIKNAKPKDRAEIRLYVQAGSLDEDENQRGLAHLIEHMAFNGIKHFKKNELIDYLQSIGMVFGGDLNANTSRERTVYMLSLPLKGDNLEKALVIVRDWADGLNFNPKEYDKERKVVLEERRMRDTVNKRVVDQIVGLFYGDSMYLHRDPIGKVDVIEHSDVKLAKAFYDKWYRPEHMHLVIVGDINTTEVAKSIEKHMASIQSKSSKKQLPRATKDYNETQVLSITDKELTQNAVNIFYTTNVAPMREEKDKRATLIKNIIPMLFNLRADDQLTNAHPKAMTMRMFMEQISQNRLVYTFAASYKDSDGEGALAELTGMMTSFEKYGFSETNFALAKKLMLAKVEKTHARVSDRQSKNMADVLIETINNHSVFIDEEYDYALTKRLLSKITLEELNGVYRDILHIQNRAIVFKDIKGNQFAKQKVLDIYQMAKQNAKDLSKVKKLSTHIIDENLTMGKIVSKKVDKALGIYHYVLENNISVDFKPSSKDKNLLLLEAFSEGGYSILKDRELILSKKLTDIITQSAPEKWSNTELEKILTGKQVSVTPSIERFGEKIVASCNIKDIDTMFELLYARITAPKVDDRVLQNFKSILSNNMKQIKNNPEYIFLEELLKFYYDNNPELKPISIEDINSLDAKSLLALYRDRFGDMNNFHFTIAGDTTPEVIEKLIGKYLTHLPTQPRVETHGTKSYTHPKGKVEFVKYYNTENRANVKLQYSSKLEFKIKNNISALLVTNLLNIKLRELIREEKSGVYNIDVNSELTHEIKDEVITNIAFVCDPKRKDELINAIYPAIEKFIKDGVTEKELTMLKKMIHLGYKNQIDSNSFWVEGIMSSYRFDTPITDIIDFPKIIDSIDVKDLQRVAKALFGGDLLVTALMPKSSAK